MKNGMLLIIILLLSITTTALSMEKREGIKATYFKCPGYFSENMDPVFLLFDQRKYDQVLTMAKEVSLQDSDLLNRDKMAWLYLEARSLQETLDSKSALLIYELYRNLVMEIDEKSCDFLFDYYVNTARCHIYIGSVEEGIARLDSAYLISDKSEFYDIYQLYRTEAYLFQQQGQYRAAIDQMHLAYEVALKAEQPIWVMDALYGMSLSSAEIGAYREAIRYLKLGEEEADFTHNLFQKWRFLACNGICHIQSELYEQGVNYLQKAADLGVSIDRVLCCGNDAFLAKGLYMTGRKEKAVMLAEKAWTIVSTSDNTRDRRNVLHALFDIYQAEGNLEKALEVQSKLYNHREALHNRNYDQLVANMEVKYRARESALELAERSHQLMLEKNKHEQKRIILLGTSVFVMFLIILVIILWRINMKKTQVAGDLHEKNQILKRIDKTKNQFFEDVSHEFRTPLSLIIGHLNELEERIKSPANQEHLKTAVYNANRLTDMVNQLLELSKIQSVKISVHTQKVLLYDWLAARIASFHSIAHDRAAMLEKSVEIDDNTFSFIDADKMEKVLNNLLHNACKYVSPGGIVYVKAFIEQDAPPSKVPDQNQKSRLVISVANTIGQGASVDKNQIFNRHYQKNEEEGLQPTGFGIGLALTKDFLQLMGGDIHWVDSREGLFELKAFIPVKISTLSVKRNDQSQLELVNGKVDVARILVVEDQDETRGLLKSMLQSSYKIVTADRVGMALEILRNQRLDLMITDMWMPDRPGLDLVAEIRNQPTVYKNIPIIMLSGDVTDTTRLGVLKQGADIFLPKPIHKQDLLTHIENLLQKSQSRKSNRLLDSYNNELSADQILLDKAETWIFDHLGNPNLTVGDIAAYMNISERSLERLFKRTKGITPIAFLKAQRMHVAYHLLLEGRCSTVTEARVAVGIENASYFSRNFAKYYGFSPGSLLYKEQV